MICSLMCQTSNPPLFSQLPSTLSSFEEEVDYFKYNGYVTSEGNALIIVALTYTSVEFYEVNDKIGFYEVNDIKDTKKYSMLFSLPYFSKDAEGLSTILKPLYSKEIKSCGKICTAFQDSFSHLPIWNFRDNDKSFTHRALILDFIYSMIHEEVLKSSSNYGKMYKSLMSDFYFGAIIKKSEYYLLREQVSRTYSGDKLDEDLFNRLDNAEQEWTGILLNPLSDKLFREPSPIIFNKIQFLNVIIKNPSKSIWRFFNNCVKRLTNGDFGHHEQTSWFILPEDEIRRFVFPVIWDTDTGVSPGEVGEDNTKDCTTVDYLNARALALYEIEKENRHSGPATFWRDVKSSFKTLICSSENFNGTTVENRRIEISKWFFKKYIFTSALRLSIFDGCNVIAVFAIAFTIVSAAVHAALKGEASSSTDIFHWTGYALGLMGLITVLQAIFIRKGNSLAEEKNRGKDRISKFLFYSSCFTGIATLIYVMYENMRSGPLFENPRYFCFIPIWLVIGSLLMISINLNQMNKYRNSSDAASLHYELLMTYFRKEICNVSVMLVFSVIWTLILYFTQSLFAQWILLAGFIVIMVLFTHIVKYIHIFMPRLIVSISAAWVTLVIGNTLSNESVTTTSCIIIGIMSLIFVLFSTSRANPCINRGILLLRTIELLMVCYGMAVVIGLFAVNLQANIIGSGLQESAYKWTVISPMETFYVCPEPLIKYSFLAVFIGVFINMIFEEKHIAEI